MCGQLVLCAWACSLGALGSFFAAGEVQRTCRQADMLASRRASVSSCLRLLPLSHQYPTTRSNQAGMLNHSDQLGVAGGGRLSVARSCGQGVRLCSDFFEVGGQLFRVEVFPGGCTPRMRKYVSVFLTTPGCQHPNQVVYSLSILDQVRASVSRQSSRLSSFAQQCLVTLAVITAR
jgi:hypothetical protein